MHIYKITNLVNNKCYIGQTTNRPETRFKQHRSMVSCGTQALYRAFRKYGISNFSFEVILTCNKSDLDYYETKCIELYNSFGTGGYNMTFGGSGSMGATRENTWSHKSVATRKKNGKTFKVRTTNYEIEDLVSNTIIVGNCLSEFCKDHALSAGNLWETFYGNRKQHKGFRLIRTFND